MGRAVLAESDAVVGEHEDGPHAHQRRHAQGVSRVLREHEECPGIRDEAAVQSDAVRNRRHRELAHSVVDVVAVGALRRERLGIVPPGEIRFREVRRASDQLGQ